MHGAIAEAGIQPVTRDSVLIDISTLNYSEVLSSL
jgi:hypothetical protein